MKFISTLENKLYKIETTMLVIGFIAMIVFGATQVILRNLFNTGIEWADMLVRALVLWTGFIGASLATRYSKHISIDALSKFIKNETLSNLRNIFTNLISLMLSLYLLKASIHYVFLEIENKMTAFLNIPTWIIFIIVPISLFIMSIRLIITLFFPKTIHRG